MKIENKILCLKQQLDNPDTSIKMRFEILGLFMSFYTKEDFDVMEFF